MKLTTLVHEDETGGYWAEVKELPGCFTQGETLAELGANLREVMELFIESLISDYRQSLSGPGDEHAESTETWQFDLSLERATANDNPASRTGGEREKDFGEEMARDFRPGRILTNVPRPIKAPNYGPPVKKTRTSSHSPPNQRG